MCGTYTYTKGDVCALGLNGATTPVLRNGPLALVYELSNAKFQIVAAKNGASPCFVNSAFTYGVTEDPTQMWSVALANTAFQIPNTNKVWGGSALKFTCV
jgi:hypothetical protein